MSATKSRLRKKLTPAQSRARRRRRERPSPSEAVFSDELKQLAEVRYVTGFMSLVQLHDEPTFAKVHIRTLEKACRDRDWVEKRRAFRRDWVQKLQAEIRDQLVAERRSDLERARSLQERAFAELEKKTVKAKSFEQTLNAVCRLLTTTETLRAATLDGIVLPNTNTQPQALQVQSSLTPAEAQACAHLLTRMRREAVRAQIETKNDPGTVR